MNVCTGRIIRIMIRAATCGIGFVILGRGKILQTRRIINMWTYEKRLQFPVKIAQCNPQLAKIIITQYGGPDGELGASLRYLSQRFSMPYAEVKAILTDIGTEELGHLEMIGA